MPTQPGELRQLGEAFQADAGIATSHLRPDGTSVIVFTRGAAFTDDAATAAFLCRQTGVLRLPLRARRTIEGICRMNDLEFERNSVIVRLANAGIRERREAVDRLARICARISRLKIAADPASP